MASHEFHLVTTWHLEAPQTAVWDVLVSPEEWPAWWRAVKRVEAVRDGDERGVGAVRDFTWRTALPYAVTFRMTATRVDPMATIEGRAEGELEGIGRWTLSPAAGGTDVRYDWIVSLARPWQRTLAPLLRPVFAWNHNVVMGWGEDGIRRRLGIAPRR